jgi:hypothetical protein
MPERHDAVEFCSDGSEEGPYRAAYDRSVVSPSEAVVLVLTEAEGEAISDLPPLYDVVDTNALDRLFEKAAARRYGGRGLVQFTYGRYEVSVRSEGVVEVCDTDGGYDRRERE